MSDVVIEAENLGKKYLIGHQAGNGQYLALRDVVTQNARSIWHKTRDLMQGKPIVQGDVVEEVRALRDVSFEIRRGDVVGIIGRNGAGKSTLLRILSRITEPTEGRVRIKGRVASLLEVGTGFHPELSGRENIFLNGAVLGMKRDEIKNKFDEIVAFAEIGKFLDTPVKRYSSGMYVRLAFAVAAHLEPEILLVDEVLAVGDTQFQRKCLGKMGEVAKSRRTVLFVSHNMAAVQQLCSRAFLLANGCVKRSGDVSSVLGYYSHSDERPKTPANGVLANNPSRSLELLSVRPLDEEGRPVAAAQCGRDLPFAISVRTTTHMSGVSFAVGINTLSDTRVATLHSGIAGYDLSLDPGTHSITCRVPRFPLAVGDYVVDVKVLCGHELALWAPRVAQLSVEAGDFYNTGKLPDASWGGFCHLFQQWEVHDG